jgi:hypothetical protein
LQGARRFLDFGDFSFVKIWYAPFTVDVINAALIQVRR